MKYNYIVAVLFIGLVLAVGCTNQAATGQVTQNAITPGSGVQAKNQKSTDNAPAAASNDLSMDKLYNYGAVHSYEYQTTSAGMTSDMKYTIGTDIVNGKQAWLQTSDVTANNYEVKTNIWLVKSTYACIKVSTQTIINGQSNEQATECPQTGPNAVAVPNSASSGLNLKSPVSSVLAYQGEESITIPLGTFNAKKYSLNGLNYWYDPSVPVPLKTEYAGVTTELVSWS